jgi:hypothetical protein
MDNAIAKPPIHLWIIGGLAVLWNGFGCFDYFMTRTRGAAYIESMMPTANGAAMMAYIDSFPIWVSFAWGLGVWAGLAGSILLVLRHRLAVPVLLASLIGAVVGTVYQMVNPAGIAELSMGANAAMPYVIIVVATALFLYAKAMRARGVLR